MKIVVSILVVALFLACSNRQDDPCHIFSANTDNKFDVNGEYERSEGVLWIKDSSDLHEPPVFQLTGRWDFTGFSHIKVVLVNNDERESIKANFKMEDAGGGSLQAERNIRAGDTIEWLIPLTGSPKDPKISARLKGMRATPFTVDGVTSTLDISEVSDILVSFDKWLKGTTLGIREISAVKAEQEALPKWFAMSEEDFFPFVDKYGQFVHKDWPGKTSSDEDLIADRQDELQYMQDHPSPADRSLYGGWLKGKRQKATGYFYVDKIDGKWWMVDPEGYLFWSHGVVRVTSSSAVTIVDDRESYFASLPDDKDSLAEFYKTKDEFMYRYYKSWGIDRTFDFSSANIYRKYGDNWRVSYRDMVYDRLQNWGMNTISAGSDPNIYRKLNVPYCDRIELNSPRIAGAPAHLNVIRDPFHPNFDQKFREQLQERKEELESLWNYGYFIDNKLVWGKDSDLGRWVLKSPASQPAKIAFVEYLQDKYNSISVLNEVWKSVYKDWEELLTTVEEPAESAAEDCKDFSALLIEEYFKKIDQAMEEEAPGKLNLGCRYVTVNERVLQIAAEYCDVLTFDLFWDSLSEFRLPKGIDKPVLIGEFHFGATDRGLFHPGLNRKNGQEERGMAYEKYVKSALLNPFVVGTSWHQFSDQATTGRFDGENFQDGLTDVCDKPYSETVVKVKEIGANLYRIRSEQH
ncbi:hypothetical protein [Sinomicrobium sp.]